ncbi:MAG: glycosyltransferase family 39 protein [Candidatus Omnitrophota bacterium]
MMLFLICLLGAVLRLYHWNSYGFWYDEAQWMLIVARGLSRAVTETVLLTKPPLFAIILYFWKQFFTTEFMLRLVPVIFGIVSVIIIYKAGETASGRKAGLISAFILALSPFHIYYSQELTHYSLTLFCAVCSFYHLLKGLKENRWGNWLQFALYNLLGLYTNFVYVFFLFSLNTAALFYCLPRRKDVLKKWLVSQAVILLFVSYWVALFLGAFFHYSYPFATSWIPKGSLLRMFQVFRLFNAGYNAASLASHFLVFLFFPLFFAGIARIFKNNRKMAGVFLATIFMPVVLAILFSRTAATFTYRNFIFIMPVYYVCVSIGIAGLRRLWLPALISYLLFAGSSLINYYHNVFPYYENDRFYQPGVHPRKDSRAAALYVIGNFKKGDAVAHVCTSTLVPYMYYASVSGIDELREANKDVFANGLTLVAWQKDKIARLAKNKKRLWLVFSAWHTELLDDAPGKQKLKAWVDRNFTPIGSRAFAGVRVFLYEIPLHN